MFIVDVPNINSTGVTYEWIELNTFKTKEEAVKWIRKYIGHCDDEGNVNLISEIDTPENPER